MDPLRLCLALGPPAIYLVLLGAINLGRRPRVVAGARDAAALGLALAGFAIIGPIELFFPHDAAARFGPYAWLLVLVLYALCLALMLLLLRPRLVIYNVTPDQLRPVLAELVARLDAEARWAGDTLFLPALGVQLHVENFAAMRNVSLVAVGPHQNHQGWRRLEQALAAALGRVEIGRNARGASLLSAGLLILAALAMVVYRHPETLHEQLVEVLAALKKALRIE
jgi:hypothetical protein